MMNINSDQELQPAHALWKRLSRETAPYRFQAASADEAGAWQLATRQALAEVLGVPAFPPVPLNPTLIERVDRGDFVREKVLLHTGDHTVMPVYLLLPKGGKGLPPTVLAFHGHGYGVKDIVGLWEDGTERYTPDGYHQDFAVALCRRGFAVAAPEISCFGERVTDFGYLDARLGQGAPTTCTHTAMLAFHLGINVVGMRVTDGMRLVDYLQTRGDLDAQRLGAMGISIGAVKQSMERTQPIYALFGAGGNLAADYFEGRHRINGGKAYAFLVENLMNDKE